MNPLVRVALLAVLVLFVSTGCRRRGPGGPGDAGVPLETAQFTDTYLRDVGGECTGADLFTLQRWEAHAPGILGYAPVTEGVRYPLFIWTSGTLANYLSEDTHVWLKEMASRGFVAAALEYDNGLPLQTCPYHEGKAHCAYDPTEPNSAVSRLCGRADVDCSRGIVTAGHSQGAAMAVNARNYDMRVRATWMLGATCDYAFDTVDGLCNPAGPPEVQCLLDVNTALATDRLRIISGDREEYGDQTQNERMTGKVCPPETLDCLSADGSGWYRIPSEEVEDFHGPYDPDHSGWGADHCFWVNSTDGAWCRGGDAAHPPDENWLPPAALTWSLSTNLTWLQGFVNVPNVPQRIDSGALVSHADFVKDQKQVHGVGQTTATAIDVSATATGAAPEQIYRSAAEVDTGQSEIVYALDEVGAGEGYTVRLHFAETVHSASAQRLFHVRINGIQVETDLDVLVAAGGANRALVRSYEVIADEQGVVTVALVNGAAGAAMVSGVELF